MDSVLLAWMVGEGMMVWRIAKQTHSFPIPSRLLVASFAYGACAIVQQVGNDEAGKVSKTFAWGLTIATSFLAFQTKSTPKKGSSSSGSSNSTSSGGGGGNVQNVRSGGPGAPGQNAGGNDENKGGLGGQIGK